MKYVKLVEGQLEYAPQNKGAIINYNTNVELMVADGYKLLVEVVRPTTNRKYHINYTETSTEVQESIIYEETQAEADARELAQAKSDKYAENDNKAEDARTSKTFTLTLQNKTCEFDTKSQTQTDLLTAFAVCSQGTTYDGWVCNNGTVIDLTLSDVTTISVKFKELSNVYPHWNYYKGLIDNATTIAEVKAIVIDYDTTLGEE